MNTDKDKKGIDDLQDRALLLANVAAVEEFLKKDDWHCKKEEYDGVVIFRGGVTGFSGIYKDYSFSMVVEPFDVQCFARFPASVKNAIDKIAELVARINYQLKYGGFELDCDEGLLRFHMCVPAVAVRHDTLNLMRFLMLAPARMLDQYATIITSVLIGQESPKAAMLRQVKSKEEVQDGE